MPSLAIAIRRRSRFALERPAIHGCHGFGHLGFNLTRRGHIGDDFGG
jgi:hypothetical protein